jgi:selenocysteine-specific elongation factor
LSPGRPFALATAGHVDHGKTALVAAMTGRDTDRLPEEKRRGLSIELGYAPLQLPSGRRGSIVDVPGHEGFVRTMVAGATGVDLFLLCVAADDGVMPQTLEHLQVMRALGIERGVVAITKADLADPEPARAAVAELLPGLEAVAVASPSGHGVDQMRAAVDSAVAALPDRDRGEGPLRLHVDRSFTLKGIGTVVTGTLWSGSVGPEDRVMLAPAGRIARIRSVQVHDAPVQRARAGQRTAIALTGVRRQEVGRGDVVCRPDDEPEVSYRFDARLRLDPGAEPLEDGARVQVHHGTRAAPARLIGLAGEEPSPGPAALCQIRLEAPLLVDVGDRFVLRRIAPPGTLGGGIVLDPAARRHRGGSEAVARLTAIERGESPAPAVGPERDESPSEPGERPLGAAEIALAELLEVDGARPRADGDLAAAAGLDPGRARAAWRALEERGLAPRLGPNLHYHQDALGPLLDRVLALCDRDGGASIASVRDELGTSRRHAQALLEHLDKQGRTIRRGDLHVPRARRSA